MPGFERVVPLEDGIIVVATNTWYAMQAARAEVEPAIDGRVLAQQDYAIPEFGGPAAFIKDAWIVVFDLEADLRADQTLGCGDFVVVDMSSPKPRHRPVTAIELKLNYVRPVSKGEVVEACGRVLALRRSLVLAQAQLLVQEIDKMGVLPFMNEIRVVA